MYTGAPEATGTLQIRKRIPRSALEAVRLSCISIVSTGRRFRLENMPGEAGVILLITCKCLRSTHEAAQYKQRRTQMSNKNPCFMSWWKRKNRSTRVQDSRAIFSMDVGFHTGALHACVFLYVCLPFEWVSSILPNIQPAGIIKTFLIHKPRIACH